MKIGIGVDFHKFAEKRDLVIGGVNIPYKMGLLGHSDADVLLHAICDALLGAIGEGDIGEHFPDTEPKYKDISSLRLLTEVFVKVEERGYHVRNVDTVIICEDPKLSSYKEEMRDNIADVLKIGKDSVNIKATTAEGMGSIGKGEGIAAHAVVLLEEKI